MTTVESDGYRRQRDRGQPRRGRQTKAALDAQDLRMISSSIARAAEGLALSESQEFSKNDKEAIRLAWLAQLHLAERTIRDVRARHHYGVDHETPANRDDDEGG